MTIQLLIVILCAAGFYAAVFMYRKARRAERGELAEASVVQTAAARALFGVPNSAFGIAYYPALALAVPFLAYPAVRAAALAAAVAAAALSLYLAYSLLFRTRRSCPYCWTGHAVNWTLLVVLMTYRA